jgi:hypothetical protein
MYLNKTTFYLTNEVKELLRKTSYLSRCTKTKIVNDALMIGLNKIIKQYRI